MTEEMVVIMDLARNLLCLISVVLIFWGTRRKPNNLDGIYLVMVKVQLPAIVLHYISVVFGVLVCRFYGRSDKLYLFLVCFDAFLIEYLLSRILRLKRYFQKRDPLRLKRKLLLEDHCPTDDVLDDSDNMKDKKK